MYRYLLLLLVLYPCYAKSQIFPREGSHLNFRIIGFLFPDGSKTGIYTLEIAKGHFDSADSFTKNIINTIVCKTNKVLGEVPAFGSDYTWHTVYANDGKKIISALHHFSTDMSERVDTATSRLGIIKNAEKYKDAHIFIDETAALYDMSGHPVWFLPDIYFNGIGV